MEETEMVYSGWYRLSMDLLAMEMGRILELGDRYERDKRLEELKALFDKHSGRRDCE